MDCEGGFETMVEMSDGEGEDDSVGSAGTLIVSVVDVDCDVEGGSD